MLLKCANSGETLLDFPADGGVAQEWSEESFRAIFLKHYGRITGLLCRLLGDSARAEDLASEVFWKMYRARITPGSDDGVGAWLYRTAVNLGIDALRSEARRKRYEAQAVYAPGAPADFADPLHELLREERRMQVRMALARLRPAQAQLLVLRASGFSYHELSAILNLRAGSVGTMLIRAEAKFRERYVEMYGREEAL